MSLMHPYRGLCCLQPRVLSYDFYSKFYFIYFHGDALDFAQNRTSPNHLEMFVLEF